MTEHLSYVDLTESPLIPGVSPVRIYYRQEGSGFVPLLFLHGGWGYEVYPFDAQIEEFGNRFKIIIPDRTGYGRSMRIHELPFDFHQRAAAETLGVMDALGIDKAFLWGHSDGAVIAAILGLQAPDRFHGLILEAFHYDRSKKGSRQFFETMVDKPKELGDRATGVLIREHGDDYWQELIRLNGRAWLTIGDEGSQP